MSKKVENMFECPSCGNEVHRTNKDKIKCPWCEEIIIPRGISGKFRFRETVIYKDINKE